MLENCELGLLPAESFLDRALNMSPVFRQHYVTSLFFNEQSLEMMAAVYFMCLVFWVPTGLSHSLPWKPRWHLLHSRTDSVACSVVLSVLLMHVWVSGFFDVSLRSVQSDHHSEGHGSLS